MLWIEANMSDWLINTFWSVLDDFSYHLSVTVSILVCLWDGVSACIIKYIAGVKKNCLDYEIFLFEEPYKLKILIITLFIGYIIIYWKELWIIVQLEFEALLMIGLTVCHLDTKMTPKYVAV